MSPHTGSQKNRAAPKDDPVSSFTCQRLATNAAGA